MSKPTTPLSRHLTDSSAISLDLAAVLIAINNALTTIGLPFLAMVSSPR